MHARRFRGRPPVAASLFIFGALFSGLLAAEERLYDWSGTWETSRGTMELVQTGNSKMGGEVTGKVKLRGVPPEVSDVSFEAGALGNTLAGAWRRSPDWRPPDNAGDFHFTISEDGLSFTGKWRKGYGPETGGEWEPEKWEGEWTGKRAGGAAAVPPPRKRTVSASAEPSFTAGGRFTTGTFTIGGEDPQTVRVTAWAENFAIKKQHGGIVYQVTKGKSWGSLKLAPGTYVLSCKGGGALGTMSAKVSVEYDPGVTPPPDDTPPTDPPGGSRPDKPDFDPGAKPDPEDTLEDIDRIYIRSERFGGTVQGSLLLEVGRTARFSAWGANADRPSDIRPVAVDRWSLQPDDQEVGSINEETGQFTAGSKAGDVWVIALVGDLTGQIRVRVTLIPPVVFSGRVELLDEKGTPLPIPPGGVLVTLHGRNYKDRDAYDQVAKAGGLHQLGMLSRIPTDAKGRYSFPLPSGGYQVVEAIAWGWDLPDVPGHSWEYREDASGRSWSNQLHWHGTMDRGKRVVLKPDGFPCIQYWCEKLPVSYTVRGVVTHSGKPVEGVSVQLRRFGKLEAATVSESDGEYSIEVTGLPAGEYLLTANRKPEAPPPPLPPGTAPPPGNKEPPAVTVHDWLYIVKDFPITLPLPQEETVVNIRMVSFADRIGYDLP